MVAAMTLLNISYYMACLSIDTISHYSILYNDTYLRNVTNKKENGTNQQRDN